MRDTHEKFTLTTIGLHWIIAIGMILMLAFGLYIEGLPRSPDKGELIGLHKSIGVIILVLAFIRVYWRHLNKFPKPLSTLTSWQAKLATLAHWVLLLGTILLPVSGVMMSIGGGHSIAVFGMSIYASSGEKIAWLAQVGHIGHEIGGKIVILFILLHVAGAIKHQFIDKDGTISRMFGSTINNKR